MAQTMKRPGADAPVINKPVDPKAPWPVTFYRSAVGKKWIMAISGLMMLGFVLAHMIGNLKLYLGSTDGVYDIDHYGEALRELLYPLMPKMVVLWVLRIGLIGALIAHVHAAVTLNILNRKSRPVGYQSAREYVSANFASRSMPYTGAIMLAYIIFHLFDLTIGTANPDFVHGAVHDNMIASMQRWPVAIFYIIANIAVAVHLYHGTWSVFQSMGMNNPRYNAARRIFAGGVAGLIGAANITFPILIVLKVVK